MTHLAIELVTTAVATVASMSSVASAVMVATAAVSV
jgi:hypothetical protein